jgi:hypothetical protein
MLPYLAIILIPSLFALLGGRRILIANWFGMFLAYLAFTGLRHEVGPDWWQYKQLHYFTGKADFWEVALNAEPFSYLLFWFSDQSGMGVYFSNLVAAFILLFGVYAFARKTVNPWLAILAASPYLIIVVGMSGIRQGMAAGIVLIILSKWKDCGFIKRLSYIFVAALFHTSALVNSIFLITQLRLHFLYRAFLGIAVFSVTTFFGTSLSIFADNVIKYEQRYIDDPQGAASLGSLFHITMIVIPAALGFIFRKRIATYVNSPSLLIFGLYAAIAVVGVNFFSSTAASRLTIYLYFIPMMVYPAFTHAFGLANRQVMTAAIVILHLLILIAWFLFANNADAYIPYQNLLLL